MKPLTKSRIDQIVDAAFEGQAKIGITEFRKLVLLTLKEQDRDTRNACAEAVINLPHSIRNEIDSVRAHQACMNVRGTV